MGVPPPPAPAPPSATTGRTPWTVPLVPSSCMAPRTNERSSAVPPAIRR